MRSSTPVHALARPLRVAGEVGRQPLRRPGMVGTVALVVAVTLGVASAALSIIWATGVGVLLDTMGGSTERWGRERGWLAVVALVGWALVKLALAAATLVAAGVAGRQPSRWWRVVAWLAAVQLTVYGGLLTIGGLLVETGLVSPPDTADRHAIAWHALLWDPWTAVWGLTLGVTLWCTRPPATVPDPSGGVSLRVRRRPSAGDSAYGQPAWGTSTQVE